MTNVSRISFASILAITLGAGGCAAVLKGQSTPVSVTSNTPGATVFVDGKQAGVTPMTLDLPSKTNAVITVHRADREETCRLSSNASVGWIAADVLLTGGVGVFVDWVTHDWNNLASNTCHVGV